MNITLSYIKNRVLQKDNPKGFILLFTVVVISVTVGLSVVLLTSASRQAQLGSLQAEAQSAFYAADTGVECGLARIYPATPGPFTCAGMTPTDTNPDGLKEVYYFDYSQLTFPMGGVSPACGVVVITDDSGNPTKPQIIIEAYGYNLCQVTTTSPSVLVPTLDDPNLIERKILVRVPVVTV